jgi:rubredoxin
MSTKPTPTEDIDPDTHEYFHQKEPNPPCPVCGAENPKKNGTYQRHPHGKEPVGMQQYQCPNGP